MGKASSTKKVQRVARAGATRRSSRQRQGSLLWPAAVSLFVILGVFLIVVSRNERINEGAGPRPRPIFEFPEDHWHAALGIYECDAFLPPLAEVVNSGIHTHGDGLVHVEARNRSESGDNAVLGRFMRDHGQIELRDKELKVGDKTLEDGAKCGDRKAELFIKVWADRDDDNPRLLTPDDALDLRLRDQQIIAMGIAADPDDVPIPAEAVANLADPNAAESGDLPGSTTVPDATATTAPGATTTPTTSPAATPTTAAGSTTTATP